MAINPPQSINNWPLKMDGEHFIFKREGIAFEILIDALGNMNGNGYCIMTTNRLVLVNTDPISCFKCFDIPLVKVYGEKITRPMIGTHHLTGKV